MDRNTAQFYLKENELYKDLEKKEHIPYDKIEVLVNGSKVTFKPKIIEVKKIVNRSEYPTINVIEHKQVTITDSEKPIYLIDALPCVNLEKEADS